jgi:hypothetical protein
MYMLDGDRGEVLTIDDVLRCRESALHAAAMMAPELSQLPDEEGGDAARVVSAAKIFEQYLRTG